MRNIPKLVTPERNATLMRPIERKEVEEVVFQNLKVEEYQNLVAMGYTHGQTLGKILAYQIRSWMEEATFD